MNMPSALGRYLEDMETELKSLLLGESFPLYRMMAYHMGWLDEEGAEVEGSRGKRLRPILCLLSCEALGGDYRAALPAAAAVELVHNFSLIHDDIQDGTPERHNKSAVWWVWGPAQAINAGDGMYALARLALLRQSGKGISPEKAVRAMFLLDGACLRLCEGQYLDIAYQERLDVSMETYLQMVEGKTAALMSCATGMGALVASDEESAIQAMIRYGLKLGLAFQIRDDVLDLWGRKDIGKPLAGDIKSKKKSLPVIYALQNATGPEKRSLGAAYSGRTMDPEDVTRVIDVLESIGARDFCQEKADALCGEAIEALGEAGLSPSGLDELGEFARFLVARET
jgi:geranylgeranyl diphosphate synthase type I